MIFQHTIVDRRGRLRERECDEREEESELGKHCGEGRNGMDVGDHGTTGSRAASRQWRCGHEARARLPGDGHEKNSSVFDSKSVSWSFRFIERHAKSISEQNRSFQLSFHLILSTFQHLSTGSEHANRREL